MKKLFNLKTTLITILSLISLIGILTPPFNEFPLRAIPSIILLFILPGYALTMRLYSDKNISPLKHFLLGIILSSSLTLMFVFLSLFNILDIPSRVVFYALASFTVIMAYTSPKRRKTNNYIKCSNCNGYYQLKEGESLNDFEKCKCGGELEYVQYNPFIFNKRKKTVFKSPDLLIAILLIIITIVVVSLPTLSNSVVRIVLVPVLLFFLSGYALIVAIYPHKKSISKIKRFLLSIGSSAVILFLFVSLFIYSFQNSPTSLFIFTISTFTVVLLLISFIRRIKFSPETKFKENKERKSKVSKESKFNGYIFNHKEKFTVKSKSNYLDIILVFMVTIFTIIFIAIPVLNESFVRTIFGLLFILFLPGYSLIAALFPKKDDLDSIERLALSFGLSIAVSPLIGLLLNYTPFGIRLTPILISLSIFTISMLAIAFLRRKSIPEDQIFSVDFSSFFRGVKSSFSNESRTDKTLSIILILSIIIAISATIYIIITPKEGEKFTEFYILGPNGKAGDYPTNLTSGQRGNVTIGIVNHEYANVDYKLMIKLNNQTLKEENITLANNEKYEKPFIFTASGGKQKLEFLLYKLPDDTNVYRDLHLWIGAK
ncbi:DUF1616 domain-containing protein [Methanobacterium sp. ACI-7]|uniref:DUF1616 domain-containing protein n=1 Tax=unclassified Methanobacterium TaxID=2627676 RepID=UPI0039C2C0F9